MSAFLIAFIAAAALEAVVIWLLWFKRGGNDG